MKSVKASIDTVSAYQFFHHLVQVFIISNLVLNILIIIVLCV